MRGGEEEESRRNYRDPEELRRLWMMCQGLREGNSGGGGE